MQGMQRALIRAVSAAAALLLLASCSKFGRLGKGEGTTVTFSRAGADGKRVGPDQLGGVIIWGESADTNEQISFVLATNTATYSKGFKNGNWTFYAVGWEGPSDLQGTVRCAVTAETFAGGTENVVLSLGTDCSNSFFGPSAFLTGTAFRPLNIVSCVADPAAEDGDENCNGFGGAYRSFQVALGAKPEFTSLGDYFDADAGHKLTSDCFAVSGDATQSVANTGLELPVGDGQTSQIHARVIAHTSTDCTDSTPDELVYYHGLYPGVTASGDGPALAGTSFNAIHLVSGTPAIPDATSISRATGGWGGGYSVTISGSSFIPDDDVVTVTIGGNDCTVTSAAAGSITCVVENMTDLAQLSVSQDVIVSNDGVNDTTALTFTYVDDGMGNGADADLMGSIEYTIDASISDTSTALLEGTTKKLAANRNVTAYTISGSTTTFTLDANPAVITSSDFEVGDEIMWHVTAATGDTACHADTTLTRGKLGFARISNVTASNITVNAAITTSSPGGPAATAIANFNRTNTDTFCVIQVVRVPNLKVVTLDSATAGGLITISPPAFDFNMGRGGIFVMRTAEEFEITGANGAVISATGKGFPGGAVGYQGSSRAGTGKIVASADEAAGAPGVSSSPHQGAGGGANEANGGDGGNHASSAGAFLTTGCYPSVNCANMGAGGGGGVSASNGGAGGGVALLYARYVASSAGGVVVKAEGLAGTDEAEAGGGGGAGGTAFLQSEGESSTTATLGASGGDGGTGSDGTNGGGGGGGGGGTVQVRYCASSAFPTRNLLTTGGAAGAGVNYGTAGGAGVNTGARDFSIAASSEFCP